MRNLFKRLRHTANKPLLFGFYGALGYLIVALLLGETLLALTKLLPSTDKILQAVALLVDTSGSMNAGKLQEVKQAAANFVQRQTSNSNEFAVVGFGSRPQVGSSLSKNSGQIQQAMSTIRNMEE
jgi:Ca-activated chloride channel family protein